VEPRALAVLSLYLRTTPALDIVAPRPVCVETHVRPVNGEVQRIPEAEVDVL
jgi:hypothetical protein